MPFHVADGMTFNTRNDADARVVDEVVISKTYEKPKLGFRVLPHELWLDLGANIGAFSVWASKKRAAEVVAVEPIKENVELLQQNIQLNNANVKVIHAAVGVQNGTMEIKYNAKTPARSSTFAANGKVVSVPMLSLNELIAQYKPAGLKIDIEGGELDILDAGLDLTGIRAIALEYHFRFDKNMHSARRRIAALDKHFLKQSVQRCIYSFDRWPAWQDTTMFFWM